MMNRYMENNKFYRPTTMESIAFNEPKKAILLETYFAKQGIKLSSICIPTVNLTCGIISPRIAHICSTSESGYVGEVNAINKSCESGNIVRVHKTNNHYYEINGCRFAYAADLPIAYLAEIMSKNKDNKSIHELYNEYYQIKTDSVLDRIQLANIKDMNRSLKNQNEALKAQIDELKSSIEKLFEIASK